MQAHHYLGALPKIGNTAWYVARWEAQWVALLSFSACALKCSVRDRWIGWSFRHQFDRLNLVANNSRFLILPHWHYPNLASRVLSLSRQRIQRDWIARFGYPLLLLETFVDPSRYQGTIYHAANWQYLGDTRGYQRTREGYSRRPSQSKRVFVLALQRNTRALLSRPLLNPRYHSGAPRMQLTAEQMHALPAFFKTIADPRRAQGRRHRAEVVLALTAAAVLCGMRGYKDIAGWAQRLGQKARARFRCTYRDRRYLVPSESTFRQVLIRIEPEQLNAALMRWNAAFGGHDESLAIDGKTMCNAIDEHGRQTHIMSVIGHHSVRCYTQKKSVPCP